MRILHTADLHLGRQFNGISLESDHEAILDQVVTAIQNQSVEVLVIAGDIFDRASPPASAVRQFNRFLEKVSHETDAAVVLIAGNHDSPDRIESMSLFTDSARALVRGVISAHETPLLLADDDGNVAFSALPFSYENAAKECFADEGINSTNDVLTAQLASARANLTSDARWVVVAHAFVTGADQSDSEKPLARVGGIETVDSNVFEGANYVALGHLHRPQHAASENIRYSGSPLAYSFSEEGQVKSMSLINLDGTGRTEIEAVPFKPLRKVRTIRGKHADLMLAERSEDIVRAVLTDEAPVIDAMRRLREVFPNACELVYQIEQKTEPSLASATTAQVLADPLSVLSDFLVTVRGESASKAETDIAASALSDLEREEDSE